MKMSELLRKAKALIDTEATWTTKVSARDAEGKVVASRDSTAVAYCAYGAIWHIDDTNSQADAALTRAATNTFGLREGPLGDSSYPYSVASVNDELGFDAVHIMYDEAIEERESQDD